MVMSVCTRCGYDLYKDTAVSAGGFAMTSAGQPLTYRGEPITLTAGEKHIVWSLLKAAPHALKIGILLERLDSDGYEDTVRVLVCRIRRKIRDTAGYDPIETIRGKGYRWRDSLMLVS